MSEYHDDLLMEGVEYVARKVERLTRERDALHKALRDVRSALGTETAEDATVDFLAKTAADVRVMLDHARFERDAARTEIERLKAERAEDDAEVVTYKDEVLRLRCALLREERERDHARREAADYANRLDDERFKRGEAVRERDEARREGAEAMREAAARAIQRGRVGQYVYASPEIAEMIAEMIRALPLPGDDK